MVLNSILCQGVARKSVYKCSKKLPDVGENMLDKLMGVLGAFITWVLGIQEVKDDVWDQIFYARWVPGSINAGHPWDNQTYSG